MKKFLIAAILSGAAWTARADSMWELVSLTPFPMEGGEASAWQTASLESLYQTGGGFAAAGREGEEPVSREPLFGAPSLKLEHASWGFGVSELSADFNLGDYCTDFPVGEIDWAATETAITNSAAYKNGYLFYVPSADTPEKRVLFTRGGTVEVPWVLADGTASPQTYTIGQTTSARPYRIFWTETPFTGPKIDLSAHPHVRLLGDPEIVKPVYEATAQTAQTGVSNLVRGVVFDDTAKVLRCYCRVIDEATQEYDGPEGQFVLAYYDSGRKDNLVATIVVEVCTPDVTVIKAGVGEELRPMGGGYDIEGLESEIQAGVTAVTGDDASPYLEKHQGKTNWSPKHKSVFAISPTDATTTKTGESAPWRADIYWKAPDPLDVLWPFEEDWYEISWPSNAPAFIVSGDASAPGLPIFAPTNLTAAVCAYQSPANIASASSDGCISATTPGWFTVKLTADDDIWFQSVHAVERTDPGYAMTNAPEWQIGHEIALKGGAAAENTEDAANVVDGTLPGYIYTAASTGRRNWNPRLYHEPKQDSATDGMDDGSNDDAYAGLASAIYPVNTAETPIEVWWSRSVDLDGGGGSIRIPCVVQRYTAVWPDVRDVQDIVIASQKGSDGMMAGASQGAFYINSTNVYSVLFGDSDLDPGLSGGLTFGFWVNPSPAAATHDAPASGLVATLRAVDDESAFSFRLASGGGSVRMIFSTTEDKGANWNDVAEAAIGTNDWTHVALALGPATNGVERTARIFVGAAEVWNGTLSLSSLTNDFYFALGGWLQLLEDRMIPAAANTAVDGVSVWLAPLDETQISEMLDKMDGSAEADLTLQCRLTFDAETDMKAQNFASWRLAYDRIGARMLHSEGALKMSPGAPERTSGIVTSDGGVAAEVYYVNDASATGFNPTDEHAFLVDSPAGGKVVHALRCDLATEKTSEPFVLVQYAKGGKGAMRVYHVSLTNGVYSTLGSPRTAGLALTPPAPLNILDYAENSRNFAVTVSHTATNWSCVI